MTNHYHVVIETPRPTLSVGMRDLNGIYASRFNERHDRVGHVFGERYKAVLVDKEAHHLECCRYVVLNPVRAGICADPAEWPWSSYAATAGLARRPPWLTTESILGALGTDLLGAQARYRAFVFDGIGHDLWSALRGRTFLGSPAFAKRHAPRTRVREVARAAWQPVRPPLAALVDQGTPTEVRRAVVDYGYRLREIADQLGVHPATAGRRLKEAEDARAGHRGDV